jgi:hypothetical protein
MRQLRGSLRNRFQASTTIMSRTISQSSKKGNMYNQRQTRWFGQRKPSRRVTKRTLAPKLEELNCIASKEIYSSPLREGMFRLVTLCAGSQSERIRCRLTESLLSSPTPYNALSYVWGSTRDPGRILLDSQEYLVTRNLFGALKELRLPDSDKVLWVDALCINQSDIAERSAQVILMDSVYKQATRVIAWLGPHENGSALTFELLQKVELSGGGSPYLFPQGLRGLPLLLAREYWSRAWIIQEMEFARELRIRCGPDEASYSTLFKLKNSLLEGTSVISEPKALRFNRNVSVQRSSPSVFPKQIPELGLARSGQGLSPVIYLDRLIHSKCSDRHDSVLAFYNLFSVEIRTQIEGYKQGGFYEMPPDKFLIQAMRAIIEVTQNLYILL